MKFFFGLAAAFLRRQPASLASAMAPAPAPSAASPIANGLHCVKWRKTFNCDPSGVRDPMGDKNCQEPIPQGESGFCECEGYAHVSAVPCDHGPFSCAQECTKTTKLVREVFGGNPDQVAAPPQSAVADQMGDPYKRARDYGEKAVTAVNQAVNAANQGLQESQDMISRMMSLKPWKEIEAAGKQAEEAGQKAQEMAKLARPYIY
eukprot:GEMP01104482.1.p1 GENE.GEMP01104482.1~~GEMP01104482.1.p1  ORF type:complete len:205 (+),score=44.89 GEMP01104482.1:73-687(+)